MAGLDLSTSGKLTSPRWRLGCRSVSTGALYFIAPALLEGALEYTFIWFTTLGTLKLTVVAFLRRLVLLVHC